MEGNYNVFIYFYVFYILLYTYFRPDQECAKYHQIEANKNTGDFITLSAFLSLHYFKMFITSISSI